MHQNVPSGKSGDYRLTGLRSDHTTDRLPGVFRESPSDLNALSSIILPVAPTLDWDSGKRLPDSPPQISVNVVDHGRLNEQSNPTTDHALLAPEVVHLSRFALRYKFYPEQALPTSVELCFHNSKVAGDLLQHELQYMWQILATLLESTGGSLPSGQAQNVLQYLLVPTVRDLLEERAEEGDVQTCVAICETLQLLDGENILISGLTIELVREWYLSYIDLMQGMSLFCQAAHLIKMTNDRFVGSLNQQATTIYESCPHCRKPLDGAGSANSTPTRRTCPSCRRRVGLCSVCHEPCSSGLYVWCPGCGHGGHVDCIRKWLREWSNQCPTGCGHIWNGSTLKTLPRTDSVESWEESGLITDAEQTAPVVSVRLH